MKAGTVSYNTAGHNGGGASIYGGNVVMESGTVEYNTAGINGGGIALGSVAVNDTTTVDCKFEMKNGTVQYNTAYLNGGGFSVDGGDITMENGIIDNNTATTGSGGGGYVMHGKVELKAGTISNNVAEVNGGGLAIDGPEGTAAGFSMCRIAGRL
jgi:hypothetical protein